MGETHRPAVRHGPGPFVTWVVRAADGAHELQTSRRARKRLAPLSVVRAAEPPLAASGRASHHWFRLWAPTRLAWWTAVLFMNGSVLFAVVACAHRWFALRPGQLSWWIVAATMVGSVFFVASGVASFTVPAGNMIAPFTASAGTVAGAVCFFVGAYLLVPEQFEVAA